MPFPPGWDAIDRLTLRFIDADLERSYLAAVLETRRRRQRSATLGGFAIFLALGVIAPVLIGVAVWPASTILAVLAATNLLSAFLVSRAVTVRQLDAIGIGIQLSSGFLLLLLMVSAGLFTRFAAPALMATAIFAFGVSRHPFRNAVVISTGQTLDFLAFGVAIGLLPGVLLDTFILGTAVAGACVGTYIAERNDRRLYAQGLVVADLHQRVDGLLHRYLAPEVADTLISDPTRAELGGEEAEVTVLFADLTGFTAFSERVRPREAVDMLNRAFSAAVPVVLAEGGTIVQFAGDAMMAIFNAPVRQPDHAVRAARAALRMQEAVYATGMEADVPRFRVGLNTGPALVGNVGSADLQTFTAIGDTTNLAARLQTFAAPGSIVAGERTVQLLGHAVSVRPLGEPELKGKSTPVKVYEVIEMRGAIETPAR